MWKRLLLLACLEKEQKKTLFLGGLSCGTALFIAGTLQQLGIYYGSSAGKAGFLTACYILLVPILSLFLKKRCGWNIWVAVLVTMIGLYLLCINGAFGLNKSDILLLLCALVFAIHILIIDRFSPLVDGELGCMDTDSVCWYYVLRCGVYVADNRTEWIKSNSSIPNFEPGICNFRNCRWNFVKRKYVGKGISRLRAYIRCDHISSNSS